MKTYEYTTASGAGAITLGEASMPEPGSSHRPSHRQCAAGRHAARKVDRTVTTLDDLLAAACLVLAP